ncbi:Type I inositol-1,4,5-trisphosphate 5-phosphatase CVP2 [Hordeum vulgare]|nr:Type I inositol-1,4,5-trisphosphate 5-phosphatase CVP2 [Hordeum vulgare]
MHSPTSLNSNAVPRDIPKPASADELAKNGNKKKSFMSNIFRKKGRSGAGAGTSDKRPPSRRDRDFLFDLEEKCSERAEFLEGTPTVRKSVSDRHCASRIESLTFSCLDSPNRQNVDTGEYSPGKSIWITEGVVQHALDLPYGSIKELPLETKESLAEYMNMFVAIKRALIKYKKANALKAEDPNPPYNKARDLFTQANILHLFKHADEEDIAPYAPTDMLIRLYLGTLLDRFLLPGTSSVVTKAACGHVHDLNKVRELNWPYIVLQNMMNGCKTLTATLMKSCVVVDLRTRDEIKLKFDDVTIDEKTYVGCFKPGGLMNSKILHLVCDLWSQSMDDAIILQEASVLELLSETNYKVLKNDLTADKAHKEKIFIPLASHGHFSLVVVLKTRKEKLIIDSLPATHDIIIDSPETHDSMALTLLRELDSYLLDTHGVDISEYSVKRPNVQPQDNNRDCGFHVLLYIDGLKLGNVSDISNITTERVSVFRAELSASLYNHIGNEKNVVSEVEVDPNEDDGKIVETGDPSANLQEVDRNDEHQNNGSVPLHTSAENTPEELSSGTVAVTAAAVLVAPLETVNIVQPGSSSVATTAPEKNDASQGITVPHVSPPLSPADACELSLLLNPDTLEEPSEARADGSSPNLVPPEAHTSEEHADSSRIAQEDGTFASEHTSLEVQDSEDQEGNEKAEENKTPDTTTKTPSDLLGQRRPVANRRRFSEVNFQNPTLVSTEESDKIWEVIKEGWNDTVLFNMGGISLTGVELKCCINDAN